MVIRPGVCSVTLRGLSADDVVAAAAEGGLACVEWGGDVHVPTGDLRGAERVRRLTLDAGLAVASYASYFRPGHSPDSDFPAVLASAAALGAPRIRIWAGRVGSFDASPAVRQATVESTRRAADLAGSAGLTVAFEYHRGTLTDDVDSALRLIDEVGRANVASYWQPPVGMADEPALETLARILPHARAVHVFSWWPQTERQPLRARQSLWHRAFSLLAEAGRPADALLEFVPGDTAESLVNEARTLRELIEDAGSG